MIASLVPFEKEALTVFISINVFPSDSNRAARDCQGLQNRAKFRGESGQQYDFQLEKE